MTDRYGRKIKYLRLSVTDLCNLRCIYCMPQDGVVKKPHTDILSIEELTEIADASYQLGIKKIRLTGGEPLLRKGILTLCENIRHISAEIELAITTNGILLPRMAKDLKKAGVNRLNISLDTLNPDTYKAITRLGDLQDALDGIQAAQDAGFTDIKINTVLLGGINDGDIRELIALTKGAPIQLRFIELMPLGVAKSWDSSRFLPVSQIEVYLRSRADMTVDGVARVYRLPGFRGSVGLISPLSNSFCTSCDKIRVTADGKLKPCLHSDTEIDLRGLRGEALKRAMRDGITQKPLKHELGTYGSFADRNMNEIGG